MIKPAPPCFNYAPKSFVRHMDSLAKDKKSGKEKTEVEGEHRPCVKYDRMDVTIIRKNGVLKGKAGEEIYDLSDPSSATEGEVWSCMCNNGYAGMCEKVSSAPEVKPAEVAPVVSDAVREDKSINRQLKAALKRAESAEEQVRKGNETIRGLRKNIAKQASEISDLRKETVDMPGLRAENRKQREAIRNLNEEIRKLQSNDSSQKISNLESEKEMYMSKYLEALETIQRLRDELRCADENGLRGKDAVYESSTTTLRSNLFTADRYTVYFSPRKKVLRFIPSENGAVVCEENEVSIPALWRYSSFTHVSPLDFEVDGDVVTVKL